MNNKKIRPLAIVLPQFHPTPENDAWWGPGFTEWTNVTKARPQFNNHYQPHYPAHLGYYDMRLMETLEAQAQMAKEHGIYGFCYYHYWFNGKRMLHEPIDRILDQKKPEFPFMFCWANENWTRTWDGRSNEVLLQQNYSAADDLNHIQWLCKNVFSDKRYITIDNKPVFAIYRANLFPDMQATITLWKNEAKKLGFNGLYIIGVKTMGAFDDPAQMGFDAALDFQPDWSQLQKDNLWWRLKYKFNLAKKDNFIFDYKEVTEKMMARPKANYKNFPCVLPSWDNSPRKKAQAVIMTDSTPALFGNWLEHTVQHFEPYSPDENLLFINAWNEWAEGNHLEPDQKWGMGFLEQVKEKVKSFIL